MSGQLAGQPAVPLGAGVVQSDDLGGLAHAVEHREGARRTGPELCWLNDDQDGDAVAEEARHLLELVPNKVEGVKLT